MKQENSEIGKKVLTDGLDPAVLFCQILKRKKSYNSRLKESLKIPSHYDKDIQKRDRTQRY